MGKQLPKTAWLPFGVSLTAFPVFFPVSLDRSATWKFLHIVRLSH